MTLSTGQRSYCNNHASVRATCPGTEQRIYGPNIHLFPPNLGGSARILDKVHPFSAVRHISQVN